MAGGIFTERNNFLPDGGAFGQHSHEESAFQNEKCQRRETTVKLIDFLEKSDRPKTAKRDGHN